jgi:hypothetical protein
MVFLTVGLVACISSGGPDARFVFISFLSRVRANGLTKLSPGTSIDCPLCEVAAFRNNLAVQVGQVQANAFLLFGVALVANALSDSLPC